MLGRLGSLAIACLVTSAVAHAARIPIDTCGVSLAAGQVGVLTTDLVCPGDVSGVTLVPGAKLLLAGYSITGGYHGVHIDRPVQQTSRRAVVRGPGTLRGAARCGLAMSARADLRDVVLEGNAECGILNFENHGLKLRRMRIAGNDGDGIAASIVGAGYGDAVISANGLEITGNAGVAARLFSPGKYTLRRFLIRDNAGGLVVTGPKPGTLAWGEILTHSCDLTASLPPAERGRVFIGTRCAP